mmetsp:Transcript_1606/g.3466  ORF Transcript_1606/g.3466 Transcript_1606/m.3466 type:complete len:366 (+) Transcript_1606:74-1171(+)
MIFLRCLALFFSITLSVLCCLRPTYALASSRSSQPCNNGAVSIKDEQITLPNGLKAQVLSALPSGDMSSSRKPPILFLHGSFHGAWCWQEKYMPFFVEEGHPCVAFSWRGTGGTPPGEGVSKVRVVEDHCADLQALLDSLPSILGSNGNSNDDRLRPIVVSHSMGGVVVMKFLDEMAGRKKPNELFSGIVSMCSVPPSGNSKTTMRYLRRSLLDTYKITVGFVLKKVITDDTICRDCFFGGTKQVLEDGTMDDLGVSDHDLARYQSYFERDTKAILDVVDLNKCVPSKTAVPEGKAPFIADLPPCLVVGAEDDFIVDDVANLETATYYGVGRPLYVDSPHDIMLGRKWRNGADALNGWIQETFTA